MQAVHAEGVNNGLYTLYSDTKGDVMRSGGYFSELQGAKGGWSGTRRVCCGDFSCGRRFTIKYFNLASRFTTLLSLFTSSRPGYTEHGLARVV